MNTDLLTASQVAALKTQLSELKNKYSKKDDLADLPAKLANNIIKSEDPKSQISQLLAELETVKVVHLTLPYHPSYEQLQDLHQLIIQKSQLENFALEIKYKPTLGAGCVIEYRDKRFAQTLDL